MMPRILNLHSLRSSVNHHFHLWLKVTIRQLIVDLKHKKRLSVSDDMPVGGWSDDQRVPQARLGRSEEPRLLHSHPRSSDAPLHFRLPEDTLRNGPWISLQPAKRPGQVRTGRCRIILQNELLFKIQSYETYQARLVVVHLIFINSIKFFDII